MTACSESRVRQSGLLFSDATLEVVYPDEDIFGYKTPACGCDVVSSGLRDLPDHRHGLL